MKTLVSPARIEVIDVLRGFSLLGIVIVHMVEQYYAGPPPEVIAKAFESTLADNIAQAFVGTFIIGKFYMIFSFLFGLSFFIQFSKNNGESSFLLRFAWRLVLLFAIGMIHHLHYRGDILTIYAMLGFGLFFFRRLPDKFLLAAALLLLFNVPSLIVRFIGLFQPGNSNPFNFNQDDLMAYYQAIKHGSYVDILTANYYSFATKMDFQVGSGRLYITLGLFLLGIWTGRKNVFAKLELFTPVFRKAIRYSLFTLLGLIVVSFGTFGLIQGLNIQMNEKIWWLVGGLSYDIFNTAMAIIYVSLIMILFQKEKWKQRLMIFYPVGRMGLTTYLMQSLIGTLLFFNYGFGLVYEVGAAWCLLIAIAIFTLQIYFSRWWFNNFTIGPVEWLWRSLTYMRVQPMRIQAKQFVAEVVS